MNFEAPQQKSSITRGVEQVRGREGVLTCEVAYETDKLYLWKWPNGAIEVTTRVGSHKTKPEYNQLPKPIRDEVEEAFTQYAENQTH